MKIGDTQSHLCKLQIHMIENGNINSNHLSNRGIHLNGKGVLQFAKNLIEGIRTLWSEKELLHQKKLLLESCDHNTRVSPNNFSSNNNFFQPNINSIDSFNWNLKKRKGLRLIKVQTSLGSVTKNLLETNKIILV